MRILYVHNYTRKLHLHKQKDTFITTYLMQLSGSLSQSVLHRNRSHDNQPIGGVRAKPLSNDCTIHHVIGNINEKLEKSITSTEKEIKTL